MSVQLEGEGVELDYKGNVEFWSARWAEDKIGFHKDEINPQLIQHMDKLTNGEKCRKFFVPLCGKSLDLVYLYKEGHSVFGVESCEKAILDLDKENQIGLKFNKDTSIYHTEDKRLQIYCGESTSTSLTMCITYFIMIVQYVFCVN